jgi:hypothetical protein
MGNIQGMTQLFGGNPQGYLFSSHPSFHPARLGGSQERQNGQQQQLMVTGTSIFASQSSESQAQLKISPRPQISEMPMEEREEQYDGQIELADFNEADDEATNIISPKVTNA